MPLNACHIKSTWADASDGKLCALRAHANRVFTAIYLPIPFQFEKLGETKNNILISTSTFDFKTL